MNKMMSLPVIGLSALSLSACSDNYTGEGAGVGAAVGAAAAAAVTGGDILTGAAAGGAIGAAAGYFVDKDNRCDGYDNRGRLDDDCYGTAGYPARRPR